jgi:beta-glucosidase
MTVAWSEIVPDDRRSVDRERLRALSDSVDTLLDAGIEPVIALDGSRLPGLLRSMGGWRHPDAPTWYADVAGLLGSQLDQVDLWVAMIDPRRMLPAPDPEVFVHLLEALRDSELVLRAHLPRARIGVSVELDGRPSAVTDEWLRAITGQAPLGLSSTFVAPITHARVIDAARLTRPLDFLAVQHRRSDRADRHDLRRSSDPSDDGGPLDDALRWLHATTPFESYLVTESGVSRHDRITEEWIEDLERIEFLEQQLGHVERLRNDGVPLDGYFVWSFLDDDPDRSSSLVDVDAGTGERRPKASFHWYRNHIRDHALSKFSQ